VRVNAGDRTLVVGPAWVGDMVMSQPLIAHLCARSAAAAVDVLAPPWSAGLLARMSGVANCIPLPVGHGEVGLGRRRRLGHSLRDAGYRRAIVLPNSLKSALVPWFAGIPRRTGWRGEWRYGLLNDLRILDESALPLMVQRFLALGLEPGASLPDPLPAPRLAADPAQAARCRERHALAPDMPLLALCPGAEFGGAKRWPAVHFAAVARHFLAAGWQVMLLGSANDRAVTGEVATLAADPGGCRDLAGCTDLAEAVDLMSLATAVVSNDSGLMHIAAALQRPLVALYGASSPGFTPPLDPRAAVLASDLDCAPCFARECPLGHHRCLRDIHPQRVIDTLRERLQEAEGT